MPEEAVEEAAGVESEDDEEEEEVLVEWYDVFSRHC